MKTFKQTRPGIKLEKRKVMKKLYGVVTLTAALMGAILLLQTTLKVAAAPLCGFVLTIVLNRLF